MLRGEDGTAKSKLEPRRRIRVLTVTNSVNCELKGNTRMFLGNLDFSFGLAFQKSFK